MGFSRRNTGHDLPGKAPRALILQINRPKRKDLENLPPRKTRNPPPDGEHKSQKPRPSRCSPSLVLKRNRTFAAFAKNNSVPLWVQTFTKAHPSPRPKPDAAQRGNPSPTKRIWHNNSLKPPGTHAIHPCKIKPWHIVHTRCHSIGKYKKTTCSMILNGKEAWGRYPFSPLY